ncbi:hypothetical protein AX17_003419 [Amanita inopinata Kibby_2008]|nr:hypothetical protein AX17_003419 [Amanita inopinata Kibby_2008]
MPASTASRQSRPASPSSPTRLPLTPVRPGHARRPSSSYAPTVLSGGGQQQKVTITRLAIEGRARQGHDGASVRMYLKMALPLDFVTPGATIPLFSEENVRILDSQVHPLDHNSVPYNFSSTVSPLLHNAARALNLPPRSSDTFNLAFGIPTGNSTPQPSSSRSHKPESISASNESMAPVDSLYTGQILVSGYAISYVLPKVFLSRSRHSNSPVADAESEGYSRSSSLRSRRASIGERNTAQFMAAIDMWVPYILKPPRSPYLLSIPTPRCLHNHIKLRIFPPAPTSSSLASLSSIEDDVSTWDLASDPHVTRGPSKRIPRTNSYSHFADDESSDSSQTGFSDGCGIQGTFPSAERIRVRWARPMKVIDVPGNGDGRRRVGVREVKGDMTCTIQGKLRDPDKTSDGIVVKVEYKGACKGIWFPGVAILLGLDVGLEAKNSDVSWVPGYPNVWEVGGGAGYTGFDAGPSPSSSMNSRASLLDYDPPYTGLSPVEISGSDRAMNVSKTHPSASNSSLLRAPLPTHNVGDYSFEGSSGENTSIDMTPSVTSSLQASSGIPDAPLPPNTPITLHLNMNELLPPVQNVFSFTISGTILLTPRMSLARANKQISSWSKIAIAQADSLDGDIGSEPILLPRFTVLAADAESTSTVVRNEVESYACTIEVFNATGDTADAQVRKTVLQKWGFTKCGDDGGRIVLRTARQSNGVGLEPATQPRTPDGHMLAHVPPDSTVLRATYPSYPKRDGPLIIPSVKGKITILTPQTGVLPFGYAVRIATNVPCETDSEWLEFGLAQATSRTTRDAMTQISVINASVDGIPVRFETTTAVDNPEKSLKASMGASFEEMRESMWLIWIKIHVGASSGRAVVVDYLVKSEDGENNLKRKSNNIGQFLLPTFTMPVGRLDIRIDTPPGLDFQTNLAFQQRNSGRCEFYHFSMDEYFIPYLSFMFRRQTKSTAQTLATTMLQASPWLVLLFTVLLLRYASLKTRDPPFPLEQISCPSVNDVPTLDPVTITTTLYTTITAHTSMEPISKTDNTELPIQTSATDVSIPADENRTSDMIIKPTQDEPTKSNDRVHAPLETAALLAWQPAWSLRWAPEDIQVATAVADRIWDAAEVVWRLFRRAYHYPLDPL